MNEAMQQTRLAQNPAEGLVNEIWKAVVRGVTLDRVLVLGCGTGRICRFFTQMGASRVVGIDPNEEYIKTALRIECYYVQGIEYWCHNIVGLRENGSFDIVVVYLNQAKNWDTLCGYTNTASRSLKPGGIVFSLDVREPATIPLSADAPYSIEWYSPDTDRSRDRRVVIYLGRPGSDSEQHHCVVNSWSDDEYSRALKIAGLTQMEWFTIPWNEDLSRLFPQWKEWELPQLWRMLIAQKT